MDIKEIDELSISAAVEVVDQIITHTDFPVLLKGPSGIGKTAVTRQIAERKKWDYIDLRMAGMLPEDFRGFPRLESWQDQIAKKELGLSTDPDPSVSFSLLSTISKAFRNDGPGLLVFEEINRAHPDVIQPIFQLIGDRVMDDKPLGKGWKIVGCINPDRDNRYSVHSFDEAFERRWIIINVVPDIESFLGWAAKEGKVHKSVISFLKSNPQLFYKVTSDIHLMPSTWERLSTIVYKIKNKRILERMIGILLGRSIAADFMDILLTLNKEEVLTATDIIERYATDSNLQDIVRTMSSESITQLSKVVSSVAVSSSEPTLNILRFCKDIPLELLQAFLSMVGPKYKPVDDPELKKEFMELIMRVKSK